MKPIILKETDFTPEILFSDSSSLFIIKGESSPEDPKLFYLAIINWLTEFGKSKKFDFQEFTLDVDLIYYNSTSLKYIYKIFEKILEVNNSKKTILIKIIWRASNDDVNIEYLFGNFKKEPFFSLQFSN